MDADRWATLQTLLGEALDLAPPEREAFAAQQDDPEVAAELAALLAAADAVPAFLDGPPAWDARAALDAEDTSDLAGVVVGPYRLVRELGRGGQGRVFLAERDDVGTRVALKLVHGTLAAPEMVARFLTERRVLAGLVHPHIARLLDAGAADLGGPSKTPYLVMEAVAGRPVTEYVAAVRAPLAERLRLFGQVCEAVAFAHQRLVVHRDLKPSNVLVEVGPPATVKLLDFGIAKLLSDEAEDLTRTGQSVLTVEYAAPEQVLGGAVTVATDVYALGVLLYELLTDVRPYDTSGGLREALRAVCDEAPPRPSTRVEADRARALRGDLDEIVAKALAKAPEARYASVGALADDLARHLGGLPVHARPQTMAYRAARYVRRHAIGVSAAALGVALLVGFGVRERALRVQAEAARAETQARADLLRDIFGATYDGEEIRPDTLRAEALIARASDRLDERFEGSARVKAALTIQIGQLYDGIRRPVRALERYQTAEQIARPAGANDVLAEALLHVAYAHGGAGRCTEAIAALDEAAALHDAPDFTVSVRVSRGGNLSCLGRYDEAIADLVVARRLEPDDGFILHTLADAYHRAGQTDHALETMRASVACGDAGYPAGHAVLTARRHALSHMLIAAGDLAAAEQVARRAYADAQRATAPTDNRTLGALLVLARVVHLQGDLAAADSLSALLLRQVRRTLPSDVIIRFRTLHQRSLVLLDRGDLAAAEVAVREAIATPLDPAEAYLNDRAGHYRTLAAIHRAAGRTAEADEAEGQADQIDRAVERRRLGA